MAGFRFDYVFLPPARAALFALNEGDQMHVRRLVEFLCADPWVDRERKFHFPSEVIPRLLYDDGEWAIIYRLVDNLVVEIWALARSREL